MTVYADDKSTWSWRRTWWHRRQALWTAGAAAVLGLLLGVAVGCPVGYLGRPAAGAPAADPHGPALADEVFRLRADNADLATAWHALAAANRDLKATHDRLRRRVAELEQPLRIEAVPAADPDPDTIPPLPVTPKEASK